MAIARCEEYAPVGLKSNYHRYIAKLIRPLICGANACMQPVAYVWLSAEQAEYLNGERFFVVWSKNTTTIEVK